MFKYSSTHKASANEDNKNNFEQPTTLNFNISHLNTCTLHTVQRTLYIENCTLYSAHSVLDYLYTMNTKHFVLVLSSGLLSKAKLHKVKVKGIFKL